MLIMFGIWFAVAGGVAILAGLSSMRRVRRLRRRGVAIWGLPVPAPVSVGSQSAGPPHRMLLQYTLADGRVMERIAPAPASTSAPLRPGEKVLLWYDPDDPDDVLVYGRWDGPPTGHSWPLGRCSSSSEQGLPYSGTERKRPADPCRRKPAADGRVAQVSHHPVVFTGRYSRAR